MTDLHVQAGDRGGVGQRTARVERGPPLLRRLPPRPPPPDPAPAAAPSDGQPRPVDLRAPARRAGSMPTGRSSAGWSRGCSRRPLPDALAPRVEAYGFEHLVDLRPTTRSPTCCSSTASTPSSSARCWLAAVTRPHVYEPLLPLLRERPPATVVVDSRGPTGTGAGSPARSPMIHAGSPASSCRRWSTRGCVPQMRSASAGCFQLAGGGFDAGSPEISPDEAKWLRKYRLELAAARPRVLMGVLGRVLRGETEAGSADGQPGSSATSGATVTTTSADLQARAAEPAYGERAQIGGVVGGRRGCRDGGALRPGARLAAAAARSARADFRRRLGRVPFRRLRCRRTRAGAARTAGEARRGRRSVRSSRGWTVTASTSPATRSGSAARTTPMLREESRSPRRSGRCSRAASSRAR